MLYFSWRSAKSSFNRVISLLNTIILFFNECIFFTLFFCSFLISSKYSSNFSIFSLISIPISSIWLIYSFLFSSLLSWIILVKVSEKFWFILIILSFISFKAKAFSLFASIFSKISSNISKGASTSPSSSSDSSNCSKSIPDNFSSIAEFIAVSIVLLIFIVVTSSIGLSSHERKWIYLTTSFKSSLICLILETICSILSTGIIFLLFSSIFNKLNIFFNWYKVFSSRHSYSSKAFCLYLFNTNLLKLLTLFKSLIEILVKNRSSLFSFTSLLLSLLLSSSPWPRKIRKSCIPFLAPSTSTLSSLPYFIKLCHIASFSSSVFHWSIKSNAVKKSSKFSYESNSLLFEEKKSSIFSSNVSMSISSLIFMIIKNIKIKNK